MRIEQSVALLASVIANGNRDIRKRPEPFTVADFMMHLDEQPLDLKAAMENWS